MFSLYFDCNPLKLLNYLYRVIYYENLGYSNVFNSLYQPFYICWQHIWTKNIVFSNNIWTFGLSLSRMSSMDSIYIMTIIICSHKEKNIRYIESFVRYWKCNYWRFLGRFFDVVTIPKQTSKSSSTLFKLWNDYWSLIFQKNI